MKTISMRRDDFQGDWNYEIHPHKPNGKLTV